MQYTLAAEGEADSAEPPRSGGAQGGHREERRGRGAAAKVIDSKAELEKRNLLSQADAQRVRVIAVADAERMKSEALVLKDNPLLIQKIVAERLSDKVQIMMVPMDGKFFFANDVLKTTPLGAFGVPHPNQH